MKITFVGVGSAFTTEEYFQSNILITADSGKKILIDCGGDIRFSLAREKLSAMDIDAVYVSHLHTDHIGGLEYVGFVRYFGKKEGEQRPVLFCVSDLIQDLWEKSLRGGLESVEGKVMNLTDYYDCASVPINNSFLWEGIAFTPVQTVHIMSGYKITHSYGLIAQNCTNLFSRVRRYEIFEGTPSKQTHLGDTGYFGLGPRVFFTTDTQFCPNQITKFYESADIIFHDCETVPYFSRVHSHYNDLKTLPDSIRGKMWLYHYQPNPPQDGKADGFLGFVKRGQKFYWGADHFTSDEDIKCAAEEKS